MNRWGERTACETGGMGCGQCGHAGVHATSLDPEAAPRVFCDDCGECRVLAEESGLPKSKFRQSHLRALRSLAELCAGDVHHWVERGTLAARVEGAAAPFDRLDPVVHDLADWHQVILHPGATSPVPGPTAPARKYDGNWAARLTPRGLTTAERLANQSGSGT